MQMQPVVQIGVEDTLSRAQASLLSLHRQRTHTQTLDLICQVEITVARNPGNQWSLRYPMEFTPVQNV